MIRKQFLQVWNKKPNNFNDILRTPEDLLTLLYLLVHLVSTKNEFGKQQSDIDLKAEEIILKHLKGSGVVAAAASEETPAKTVLSEGGEYFVTFDPILL